MKDSELIKLAAKALGYEFSRKTIFGRLLFIVDGEEKYWNPLKSTDDALKMAHDLKIISYESFLPIVMWVNTHLKVECVRYVLTEKAAELSINNVK